MSTEKLIYWHRELPPLSEQIEGEHVVEASSDLVPDSFSGRDALFEQCLPGLKQQLTARIEQEIHRLDGSCAHVLTEHIEPHIDAAAGTYCLRARVTYILLQHPPSR